MTENYQKLKWYIHELFQKHIHIVKFYLCPYIFTQALLMTNITCVQVSCIYPPFPMQKLCNVPIKQRQASHAFPTFQREIHFFSVRSLARHHVNDYVSLSDGPLTSSSSYSRLHAAVAKVRQTTRFWKNNSILDEWHHHSPILYIRLCVALWATGP